MSFESTLSDISDASKRLSSEQFISISNLDEDETRLFSEPWLGVSSERRLGIVTQIADLAEDNVELNFDTVFELGLSDNEELIRIAAVRGLHENDGLDLMARYIEMLRNDPAVEVRRESAIALGRYALLAALDNLDPHALAEVRDALFESIENLEEDERVRARAIEAAGALGGEETENLIESIYREEESLWLRVGALDAMGRSAEEVWTPLLIGEMSNLAPEMRHAAAFAAGEIGAVDAIQPLKVLAISDPDREVQMVSIRALGEIAGDHARVALKSILFEGDDDLREAVEEAMARIDFDEDPMRIGAL